MNIDKLKRCFRFWISLVLISFATQSCAAHSHEATAEKVSSMAGLKMEDIKGGEFILRVYYRFEKPDTPLHIYLEGDGKAWLSRTRASRNPTPVNPVGLNLAASEPVGNIMYIARPCQYVSLKKNTQCKYPYWTGKRFSPEIINSISAVIDIGKKKAGAGDLELIGFSGGGAVAVLVAAQRADVTGIRTVAGNLDHKVWTEHHKVDPLRGSLNAADFVEKVVNIPQVHYVGSEDEIIGHYVAKSFRSRASRKNCIKIQIVDGANHSKGWEEAWPDLINVALPACR